MRAESRPRRAPPPPQRERDMACLTRTIDADVIPRLAERHRAPVARAGLPAQVGPGSAAPALPAVQARPGQPMALHIEAYLAHAMAGRGAEMDSMVATLRQAGCSVESVYLELLEPVARRLGDLWCDDRVDFALVTVAVGRLQRVLRELSPAFTAEVEAAPHAHRALFVQAEGEQHSFGLSMLAEFFCRSGWDVLGGIGTAVHDPVERVRKEWVDMVGFSIGSEPRLARLQQVIVDVRAASLNRDLVVMVGGPLFDQHPELLPSAAADGSGADAREALRVAEQLIERRLRQATAP